MLFTWFDRARAWIVRQSRNTQIALGVGALIALCIVCAGGTALAGALQGNGHPSAATQSTATIGRAMATSKPQATAIPLITTATIGGTEAAFTSAYSTPSFSNNEIRHYQADFSGIPVLIVVTLSTDGKGSPRAYFLHLTPPDTTTVWDTATAESITKHFLPPDAQFSQTLTVSGFGDEQVYTSALLAASFPAKDFTDAQSSATVAPGTFYYACGDSNEDQGGCTLLWGDD